MLARSRVGRESACARDAVRGAGDTQRIRAGLREMWQKRLYIGEAVAAAEQQGRGEAAVNGAGLREQQSAMAARDNDRGWRGRHREAWIRRCQ
jgi:hypothetical protein